MSEERAGWAYFNEDTGMEWSLNHPVESGEVPDATEIERMIYDGFRSKYGYDDWTDTPDQQRERFIALQAALPVDQRGPA